MNNLFFRKYLIQTIAILILGFTFNSCSDEDDEIPPCEMEQVFSISEASVPDTGKVNESISMIITYYKPNPCYSFKDLDMQFDENELTLKVLGSYDCEKVCSQNVVKENFSYGFLPGKAGEYTLRFYISEDDYLIKTITITE